MALPGMIAAPALSGFYLSLGPSLAAQVLGSRDLVWGGLVIFLVAGPGAAASLALRGIGGVAAMLAGCLVLFAGVVMTTVLRTQRGDSAGATLTVKSGSGGPPGEDKWPGRGSSPDPFGMKALYSERMPVPRHRPRSLTGVRTPSWTARPGRASRLPGGARVTVSRRPSSTRPAA